MTNKQLSDLNLAVATSRVLKAGYDAEFSMITLLVNKGAISYNESHFLINEAWVTYCQRMVAAGMQNPDDYSHRCVIS